MPPNTIILNGEETAERCPSCGEWAIVRHGSREGHEEDVHLVDCPNCGEDQVVTVLYHCIWCSGWSEDESSEVLALHTLTEGVKAMSGGYAMSYLGELINSLAPSEEWKEQAWRTAAVVLWNKPGTTIYFSDELAKRVGARLHVNDAGS